MPTARTWNLAQWPHFWRSVDKDHRTARAAWGASGKGSLLAMTADHCCLSAITRSIFKSPLCKGMGRKVRAAALFGWQKKLCTRKRLNQYKDADFTMLRDACYSEHPHYKGKHSREGWKSKGVPQDCPPLPDPFWTPPLLLLWLFRSICESAVIVKERSGREGKSLTHCQVVLTAFVFKFPQGKRLQLKSFPSHHQEERACACKHWSQNSTTKRD